MNKSIADRNLLFGILALQMDFISREGLIAATSAWVKDKAKPLDQILVEHGALAEDARALLAPLIEKHLEIHDNDLEKSLASVSSVGNPVREELRRLGDADVEGTLAHVGTARTDDDPYATLTLTIRDSTSRGDRFRILRPHAKGGLGQVSVAFDNELRREVALKEIQPQHADSVESRARFVQEAEITARLEHPGIVPVYSQGQYADGRPFYAMRFIQGDSLKAAIDRFHSSPQWGVRNAEPEDDKSSHSAGRIPTSAFQCIEFRKLLGRFIDICNAVEYAHSRGVLHRDLKPGNVMLGKYGETLVVDWGLAKPVGKGETASKSEEPTLRPSTGGGCSGSTPTRTGTAMGTPAYMSPEQAAGRLNELGPASDVYSLGATLYCMLTGQPPFQGIDQGELLRRIQEGDFPAPCEVQTRVPKELEAICLKAMALEPHNRYGSPNALSEDIEHWMSDEPVTTYRDSISDRLARWARKHRSWAYAAATAVLLVAFTSTAAGIAANSYRLDAIRVNLEFARLSRELEVAKSEAERARIVGAMGRLSAVPNMIGD